MRILILSTLALLALAGSAWAGFQDLTVERVTGRRAVVQAEEAAALDGELFAASARNASIAAGGSWNCTLHAPASGDTVLWALELAANGASSLNIYEVGNASVGVGTAATVAAFNRRSGVAAEAVFRTGPEVNATGGDALVDQAELYSAGGVTGLFAPLLLNESGVYVLEVLNRNGTAIRVLIRARWQER